MDDLANRLRVTARRMFPDDDTPQRLDAVLEECDRADLSGIWIRLCRQAQEWRRISARDPYAAISMADAHDAVMEAIRPVAPARHWRGQHG